jgi:hypothetical protein
VQDAVASGSKRSKDSAAAAAATRSANVSSPSVVHSHHAILPAPAQRIPEVKQAGIPSVPDSSLLSCGKKMRHLSHQIAP